MHSQQHGRGQRASPADRRPRAPSSALIASSAVEADTSQPSIIQMPIAIAPTNPPAAGGGAARNGIAHRRVQRGGAGGDGEHDQFGDRERVRQARGRPQAAVEQRAGPQHPGRADQPVGERRARDPRHEESEQRERVDAGRQRGGDDREQVGDDQHPGRVRAGVRAERDAHPGVGRTGVGIARAEPPVRQRDADHDQRHEQQRERRRAAAAATIGPNVVASENAGPIDADESSRYRRTAAPGQMPRSRPLHRAVRFEARLPLPPKRTLRCRRYGTEPEPGRSTTGGAGGRPLDGAPATPINWARRTIHGTTETRSGDLRLGAACGAGDRERSAGASARLDVDGRLYRREPRRRAEHRHRSEHELSQSRRVRARCRGPLGNIHSIGFPRRRDVGYHGRRVRSSCASRATTTIELSGNYANTGFSR